jgi:hypothetical protein
MKIILLLFFFSIITMLSLTRCTKQGPDHIINDTVLVKIHDTTKLKDTVVRTLTLKPGPNDGQDALVNSIALYAFGNLSGNPDLAASTWTYNAQGYGTGITRGYIEFTALDGLPDSAHIQSATLYLYGLDVNKGSASPEGNSIYPGSPYSTYTDNSCWLKRVIGNWNEDSITWNNMPATTDLNKAAVPASTTQWNNNATADVTALVQDIVSSKQNYGFCLEQQNEQIYRSLNFAGSRNADSTRWPKLVVTYSFH